ncbi:hypothetical protein FOB64_002385 [Candida albicans]|uniref:Uncharacterized protein n=1 Tax=Candida albicans TaxID=5476 RepID=A0A8H6C2X9_CANAX|nr:hypothetical protein FOB64_002385 [Candida albicans]
MVSSSSYYWTGLILEVVYGVSSGEDIRLSGSLYEYYFDVIYLTWGFDILMIIFGSNKVWYGYLIIPGFAIYKLSNFILPFIKKNKSNGSTPEEQQAETKQTNSATSKRQQKLQARREKGPAVNIDEIELFWKFNR